ncbi:6,7-dimethyl-8-ribityllumazine synthase [Gorgonomyces haynaldii]|nr:6,7-dimethyl-8-ribityllumazine synthase [Gorgonomyces haynaldii]
MHDSTVKGLKLEKINGAGLKVLIVHTRWNDKIVNELVKGCVDTLLENQVRREDIVIKSVPGSFELPYGTRKLLENSHFDAAISIGVLIKGSTMHFEYIADATSHGLMRVGLDLNKPVIFGVLTCLTEEQAFQRAGLGPNSHNHGQDWAVSAIEMALLK